LLPNTLSLGAVGMFLSPTSTPDKIIGAGPYKVTQFVPNDRLVVEKWDGFFDAAKYQLGGIEWLSIATSEAGVNALQSK
jgi:peptide/nickel transport system substrate-binding protein